MNTATFSLRRLSLFIKSDLTINYSTIFTFGITIFAVLFLCSLISPATIPSDNFHITLFSWILFGGGLWLTSKAFADLHDDTRKQNFLLLPLSSLEKFLGRLLLTTIGYTISIVLIFYAISLLIAAYTWLVFHESAVIFRPTDPTIIQCFLDYILLQSVFFLGAIYFKNSNFSKTILCICTLLLAFSLAALIIFALFVGIHILYGWQTLLLYSSGLKLIFTIMVTPCAWIIAYLRLRESEV